MTFTSAKIKKKKIKKLSSHNCLIAKDLMVEQMGIEPTTYTMRTKNFSLKNRILW